jgi:aerobic-type carbon monoxide dehydrogenase small subunit (CoxS/CutS family)
MSEEERKKPEEEESNGQISRREFLRDAGLVVGGATVSSMALLSACKGSTSTETVTQAVTKTVTGASGGTQTVTVTGSTPAAVTKTVTVTTTAPGVTVTATAPAVAASSTIKLTINKGKYEVPVEPHWSLHHLLHDRLGWTGVKDMCNGYGACGACTVIVDGRPVLSCLTLAGDCDGKTIETPEGASVSNTKLLDAYVLNYCMQCGYCTPGLFVTAKALLDRIPKPTEADIREAMGGNICR